MAPYWHLQRYGVAVSAPHAGADGRCSMRAKATVDRESHSQLNCAQRQKPSGSGEGEAGNSVVAQITVITAIDQNWSAGPRDAIITSCAAFCLPICSSSQLCMDAPLLSLRTAGCTGFKTLWPPLAVFVCTTPSSTSAADTAGVFGGFPSLVGLPAAPTALMSDDSDIARRTGEC